MRWGSTAEEQCGAMPGDEWLGRGTARVVMTRAITIAAPPERVWPWIAQVGRGAGYYSVDWIDNGRKTSAQHIVSWIPEPALGDASAIGYLRHIEPGRSLAWWLDGLGFFGARASLVASYLVEPTEDGARVISRMSSVATGPGAHLALWVFRVMDSIMATGQLLGMRKRIENAETSPGEVPDPESGARDQYQLYEVLYASGESAGLRGKELAARWRRAAIEDGVLPPDPEHD